MEDVQNRPADVLIPIDRVGIKNLKLPLIISQRDGGVQHTVAVVELGVDLPNDFKGTHMSRFIETLSNWEGPANLHTTRALLLDVRERLQASSAQVILRFPYFISKKAPVSQSVGQHAYDCSFIGELGEGGAEMPTRFTLGIIVPVMTVCPCSKAISAEGAHSQRAEVRMQVHLSGFTWLEDFIDIAEKSASSPTYPALKREDEKYVTETAFANPCFVEDVVRNVAKELLPHPHVKRFRVEVESFESIHGHNAFAWIERNCTENKPNATRPL